MLLAVDSQSLLSALAKGPLLTQEDFEDQLWEAFLLLARRGCTVVLQFFYSHVSFPPRNAAVDDAVTSLLEDPALDHDAPAIWLADIIRAVHHHLYSRWLDEAHDVRTDLCGKAGAPLREMAAWSRADQTLFSRSRTDSLLELGTYRLRLGITSSAACRWCGLLPLTAPAPQHTSAPTSAAEPIPPLPPASSATPALLPPQPSPRPHVSAPASVASHPCSLCGAEYRHATSLRRHLDVAHPNDPRPVNTNTYPCECGASFPTGKSRAVHLRACPVRLAQAAAAPPPAPPPPPLRSAESVRHMLECPALAALRLHHDIHPNDDPPPVTEALTDYRWVAFLRAALALVVPPAPQPVGLPLVN